MFKFYLGSHLLTNWLKQLLTAASSKANTIGTEVLSQVHKKI